MKRIYTLLILAVVAVSVQAQNVQLHYDMGKDRAYLTSTVEMFKPDSWGSTFFFIDMDYGVGDVEGVSMAYWEVARAISLGDSPFAAHIEYNGGFGRWQNGDYTGSFPIEDAWLGGLEYSWNAKDFSRGFTLQALYKNIRGKHDASFQLTGVWYINWFDNKLSFTGFADFWREDMPFADETTKFVFLSEPQLWYNVNKNLSLGGELELATNFGGVKGLKACPTLGVKATF